jgi:hypothetical protein
VDPRAGLDAVEKRKNSQPPPEVEPPNPDRPAHSQSLYQLSYSGSNNIWRRVQIMKFRQNTYLDVKLNDNQVASVLTIYSPLISMYTTWFKVQ